jgi:hypothetical protein
MKESLRYLNNAREILRATGIDGANYSDVKPVREAFGTVYLAILEAVNEALIEKGFSKRDLPKSVDSYRKNLQKHLSIHNGKLLKEFDILYDEVHIAGYYRGLLYNVNAVKEILKSAKGFIEKVNG